MHELKRTGYNHCKAAVIGSRDQLCIHPDLAKESNTNKIQLCKIKVTNRSCHFYNSLDRQKSSLEFSETRVLDIEDLVRIGKKLKCCPYYATKELLEDSEIIFMPYNYLLDPKMRKTNKIDLKNTIVRSSNYAKHNMIFKIDSPAIFRSFLMKLTTWKKCVKNLHQL